MKKIIASALAATLLVSTAGAAMAQPYRGGDRGYSRDYRGDYRNNYRNNYRNDYRGYRNDYRYGHRNNNAGAALGIGLGILALGIIASQNSNRYDYGYSGGYYYGR
jgi:hypothetical protein